MKVKDFINAVSISKEVLDYELLIASDEEGNSYHTVDPDISGVCIKNGELLESFDSKDQMNAIILTPYKEIEQAF